MIPLNTFERYLASAEKKLEHANICSLLFLHIMNENIMKYIIHIQSYSLFPTFRSIMSKILKQKSYVQILIHIN